ncbi:2-oxoglutarate ferredoxin oxidoreductase subunit alpha [bacterium (Candidatus Blackallbacteria) CG17_big_fil_post_rev_8_21_14_2_50_48_46]|uniref:2-oxoglutarate ferredoxin oxidoreductase subunit alpha n=1 Tax=bacterium (Candidatus Blackallbacteria) CG17_big_fil_post_rev_8_21_14_2_50_48_46 TaxID=2014261 RepID=A0A2M7G9F9_9BACT|nr:MAG: 2-oxoglutarate ferredoxin oxidoreductase subunit alpha [bacterium (Candidatus Blackallbacteria) CG18_big_fil_WC_8_21_14_2_50_49_26]PIW18727.1 MAG: 2-oxoglutarate ferredoxin oxidoreductase subunit alpha [bacterium (Candidatus Blackallbacteria) CG17_big_fil_post_rev_8_21_14_2_50_48_46]PIW46601.1 MAG: 2-oxoglutarate ferredoxin oxidoreductase subunit alpha [bacterium (Candidatus Blackallbacteria) CG13_big_fil_rev_8_21_14_2_50_49_14]
MTTKSRLELDQVTIRFAGDSGDGMQLTGTQFTNTSAIVGNDLATFPDFPAEIRAPAGTLPGVSSFQVQIGEVEIYTPGDEPDVLVAMNPAALKVNLPILPKGATVVIDESQFTSRNLEKAGYASNPLEDSSLEGYRLIKVDVTKLTLNALESLEIDNRSKGRCKNFFALGMMYWMYNRPLGPSKDWIDRKFSKKPLLAEANKLAMQAGYNYANTAELMPSSFEIKPASIEPGTYRSISGNQSLALGLIAASRQAGIPLFLGTYPITPASDILHELSKHKEYGVITFQAEDEIAAVCASIGASYGGGLAVTSTSGPGICLKAEAMGLAVKTELPLVIIDVQRAGPSTGMPTKTEQSDLMLSLYSRHGESPLCVLACSKPTDCFEVALEAARIAVTFMTPVILLSDGYIANGTGPWKLPDLDQLPEIQVRRPSDPTEFKPFQRNETHLARSWAIPGMPGFEHRIGGLEGQENTGNVSYDPLNHEKMSLLREEKIQRIADFIPEQEVTGEDSGDVLVISWGGTYGAVFSAVQQLQREGKSVSHAHLRYLSPFPRNLESLMKGFKKILVPELNLGQLAKVLKYTYEQPIESLCKIQGQPFKIREVKQKIEQLLEQEKE